MWNTLLSHASENNRDTSDLHLESCEEIDGSQLAVAKAPSIPGGSSSSVHIKTEQQHEIPPPDSSGDVRLARGGKS